MPHGNTGMNEPIIVSAGIELSLGPDPLVYPSKERTGNIWLARLGLPLWSPDRRHISYFIAGVPRTNTS
jgi:hypothetical protein